MEDNKQYKVEMKKGGIIFPRFLTQWRTLGERLNLKEVKQLVGMEKEHSVLRKIKPTSKSTTLEYLELSHLSSEELKQYAFERIYRAAHRLEKNVLYRVTPVLTISFTE